MRRLVLAGLLLLLPTFAAARSVYVCQQPSGDVSVTHILVPDREAEKRRLERLGQLPAPAQCREMDVATLPDRTRPDPRDPGERLTQRHRWRLVGQRVVVDPTVQRPHVTEIRRQVERLFSPARRAALLATPLGSNLFQAVREGDLVTAKALLDVAAGRVGGPTEVLTAQELAAIRAVGRDYEGDLGN